MNINSFSSSQFQAALSVIQKLNDSGHEAFIAGGCLRDIAMGLPPHDIDITTSAGVSQLKDLFDCRAIGSGEKHGTLLVMPEGADSGLEVTTYREGARTLHDDLAHRDFTINAMAYHPKHDLIDPFKGSEDIRRKVIRGVLSPEARFREDPLRILRALRFSSVLGFEIEEGTSRSAHDMAGLLGGIASERIASELTKTLCGKNAGQVLREYHDVIAKVIPEIKGISDIEAIDAVPVMRWSALLHEIGAESAGQIMERLKFDRKTKDTITFIIANHCMTIPEDIRAVRKLLVKFGSERLMLLLKFRLAGHVHDEEEYARVHRAIAWAEESVNDTGYIGLKGLAVNGHDMIAAGLSGPEIGRALSELLEAVIDGKVINQKEALLNFLKAK